MEEIKTIEIHDKIFEETYTAHIQRNGANWLGWTPAKYPKTRSSEVSTPSAKSQTPITTFKKGRSSLGNPNHTTHRFPC